MSNAIEVRDLSYRFGKSFEIRDLALNVPTGSLFGFLGPNGAGKTTTIQLLLGLRRPRSGKVTVLGHSMPREAPRAMLRTGYIPERPHLYASLTIEEALRYHASFYPTWDSQRAEELLKQFELDRSRRISQQSKGETGKLLTLIVLSQCPDLLVLDEPTDGLDPVVRRDVMTALLEYVSQHNATVFVSSHLVHELERVCDWVGVMDRGRVVAEMPMQSFKNGIKRLRVTEAPALVEDAPFVVLSRNTGDGTAATEVWVVRGWQDPMRQYFEGVGATLKEVVDLDLEEGFVELLHTFRAARS
jgi:ABC-2 type transport system ATP-binding protein